MHRDLIQVVIALNQGMMGKQIQHYLQQYYTNKTKQNKYSHSHQHHTTSHNIISQQQRTPPTTTKIITHFCCLILLLTMISQQTTFKRRKITPLILYSQIKKNKKAPHDRNSMLDFLDTDQAKVNHRYDQASDARGSHDKISKTSMQTGNKSSDSLNREIKGSNCISPTFKRSRFNSMQRVQRNSTNFDKSPYLSQQRRRRGSPVRIKTEPQPKNLSCDTKGLQKLLREKRNKRKTQTNNGNQKKQNLTINKKQQLQTYTKIYKHFQNVLKISQSLHCKKEQKQIIHNIKEYILEQFGDSSEIQFIFVQKSISFLCKKILFLEKILVLMVVDAIISRKIKIVESNVKSALNTLIKFYKKVYGILREFHCEFERISMEISVLEEETVGILDKEGKGDHKNEGSFELLYETLLAKIKHAFKFCRNLQHFYKFHNPHIDKLTSNLNYFRLLQFYSLSLLTIEWKPWNLQFLETCPSPYLHYEPPKKLTLLLDLDETLIHYKVTNNFHGQFLIRPHLFQFLQQMSMHYELGIFTCSMPEYADLIVNHMKNISFRLYRHHTIKINNQFVKDLERVGRDLSCMILVDNLEKNFKLQKRNGVHVRSWYGDKKDDVLRKLAEELKKVASNFGEVGDVRELEFDRKFL